MTHLRHEIERTKTRIRSRVLAIEASNDVRFAGIEGDLKYLKTLFRQEESEK